MAEPHIDRYMHLSLNAVFDAIRLLEVGHHAAKCGDIHTLIRKAFGWNEIVVSPEGIVPARDEPSASRGKPETLRAKPTGAKRELVSRIFASWNQMVNWLSQLQGLRRAA